MSRKTTQVTKTSAVAAQAPAKAANGDPKADQIAQLAYRLWQERGCPVGSPDEDWKRAEAELQSRSAAEVKTNAAVALKSSAGTAG